MDVSSVTPCPTSHTMSVTPVASLNTIQQPSLTNSIDVRGKLTIQDQDLTGSDVKELKMMLEFLRYVISADMRLSELWVAYKAKDKILR